MRKYNSRFFLFLVLLTLPCFLIAQSANLAITMTTPSITARPGDNITYTIRIINNGPDNAGDPRVNDVLPVNTTFVSLITPSGWAVLAPAVGTSGDILFFSSLSFSQGSTATFILTVKVSQNASGTLRNRAEVYSNTPTPDPDIINNFALVSTTILGPISCPLNITVYNDLGQCGANVTYTAPTFSPNTGTRTVSDTFRFTGAEQTFTVPAGVSAVMIKAWGAQGGGSVSCLKGGFGGYAAGTLSVSAGNTLYVYVGGYPGETPFYSGQPGGFNGGGSATINAGAGGGASDVRTGGISLTNRVIVAGGGGGANLSLSCYGGGAGGGESGTKGVDGYLYFAGGGGTQSAGGVAGTSTYGEYGEAGSLGQGGNANPAYPEQNYWSGGGGGYYGGGSALRAAGGGGSGYVGGVTNGSMQTGVNTGNGMVVISYDVPVTFTVVQTAGQASGTSFQVGPTTNTFALKDNLGNTLSTCSFTVTVNDTEAPTFTAPANRNIPLSANCSITIPDLTTGLTGSDNCGTVTFSQSPTAGTVVSSGHNQTTNVNLTARDSRGNTTVKTVTLTAIDQTPPTISCPANITVAPTSLNGTVVTYATPTATDNCAGVTVTRTSPASTASGSTFPIGTTTVSYRATDGAGLSTTCSFTVTVQDPACGKKLDKVSVCHDGTTLCVDRSSVQDHLNHGDYLGSCNTAAIARAVTKFVILGSEEQAIVKASVYPNPTHGAFTVQLQNVKAGIAQVLIVDGKGSVVQSRQVTLLQGRQALPMNLQGNTSGLYLVKVVDGKNTQVFKVYLVQ